MSNKDPKRPDESPRDKPRHRITDSGSLPMVDVGQEGMVDIGELQLQSNGSAIPLADLPEPPSGQSLTSWTEVIRRQRAAQAAAQAGDSVRVDAPSDKDLLTRVVVRGRPEAVRRYIGNPARRPAGLYATGAERR